MRAGGRPLSLCRRTSSAGRNLFGYALFYLKSVAPPEIGMGTIFRSAVPFLLLQALGLFICITFPQLILWLPAQVYGQ